MLLFFLEMNEKVQAHAQKAFDQLRKVFDDLFSKYFNLRIDWNKIEIKIFAKSTEKHPDAHGIEVEIQDGEVVTERIIKRDIFDFFGRKFDH